MAAKKTESKTEHNSMSQNDVLLLLKILRGDFDKSPYPKELCSFRNEDNWVAAIVIYAEFDRIYKVEHIDCRQESNKYMYKRINPDFFEDMDQHAPQKSQNKLLSEFEVYINDKNTIWLTQEDYFIILSKSKRLKNKLNNSSKKLHEILKSIDNSTYSEYKENFNTKIKSDSIHNIIEHKRSGKGPCSMIYYKLNSTDIESYVQNHYQAKSKTTVLEEINVKQDSIDGLDEIICELNKNRNKDIYRRIKQIEEEIKEQKINCLNTTIEDNLLNKIKTVLDLAILLPDPNEVAILYLRYIDYISHDKTFNNKILSKYNEFIIEHTSKSVNVATNSITNNVMEENDFEKIKKGFESQIRILRSIGSIALPDVLFTYAYFCMNTDNYETAEKCFIECRDIYINTNTPDSIVDLIIVYSNLCKLYTDWNHIDEAKEYGFLALKGMKSIEPMCLKSSLNIHYAILYNQLFTIHMLCLEYDKADESNAKGFEFIQKEDENITKVFYIKQMLCYNLLVLKTNQESYFEAWHCGELDYWKTMLLCKMDNSFEHVELKGCYENLMARCAIRLNYLDEAIMYIEEGIKTYNDLCEVNYKKYVTSRLRLYLTLADIYDKENNKKAEKQYIMAKKEALSAISEGSHDAKEILLDITTNQAGYYYNTNNYDLAITISNEAISICENSLMQNEIYYTIEIIKTTDNIGMAYYAKGNNDKAKEAWDDALMKCHRLKQIKCDQNIIKEWTTKIKKHKLNSTPLGYKWIINDILTDDDGEQFLKEIEARTGNSLTTYEDSHLYKYYYRFLIPIKFNHQNYEMCEDSFWTILFQMLFAEGDNVKIIDGYTSLPEIEFSYCEERFIVSELSLDELRQLTSALAYNAFTNTEVDIILKNINNSYADSLNENFPITKENLLNLYNCNQPDASLDDITFVEKIYTKINECSLQTIRYKHLE